MAESSKAVFLSYASQDADAARRICEALRAAGVEVWFDQSELRGGDAWDQKIRKQIKACDLFIPLVSANTQARREGYFRLEWKLADDRTQLMAKGTPFLVPVCVDDTKDWDAIVPDSFTVVQWTRVPGGEAGVEKFAARVATLLTGATDGGARKTENGGRKTEGGGGRRTEDGASAAIHGRRRPARGRWIVGAVAATALMAVALGVWRSWRSAPAPAPASARTEISSAKPAAPAAPLSEARQLAEKARAIYDALDSTRDDHQLAEQFIQQARAKEPMDAEILAAESSLHQRFAQRGWDTSNERREAARLAAQKALRIDPQSFEVRFAQAGLLAFTGREGEEKERLLRALRSERPADQRVLRMLGSTIERQGRTDEAVAIMDESAALPGGDPLALYNKSLSYWFVGRLAEAEAALQASLAQKPFTGARLIGVWYATVLRGDLERARTILREIPTRELQEDRAAFFAFNVEYLGRNFAAARTRLSAVPRDWLGDSWYRGPKGMLVGDTYRAENRADAAAVEWRAALKLVEQRLAATPRDALLIYRRAQLLARLGQGEAEREAAVLLQLVGINPADDKPVPAWVVDLNVELGRSADAIRQISASLKQERHAVDFTAVDLRLSPRWDALRAKPEFAKVIAEAEAAEAADAAKAKRASATAGAGAAEFPRDPELRRARQLIYATGAVAEDFALAEDLVKAAQAQRPNDPEVVTVYAEVAVDYVARGFDTSLARRASAQRLAERAVQLAPERAEANYALGRILVFMNAQVPRAEALMRRAIELDPDEPRYPRGLLGALLAGKPAAEVEQYCVFLRARFPREPLVAYDVARAYKDMNRLPEMDRALDETLALAPITAAMIWKAWIELGVNGNVAGMKAWLDRVPERQRASARVASALATYGGISGDTAPAIKLLYDLPETWLSDFDFTGPKSLLVGDLLARDGRAELARLQYETALAEVQRERARAPTDMRLVRAEGAALLALGRKDDAAKAFEIFAQSASRPVRWTINHSWWNGVIRHWLVLGARGRALEFLREAAADPDARQLLRTQFTIDPRMAPLRNDAEIQALLAADGARKQ